MKSPDIHQFIGRIYDAALNPVLWEGLMVDISDAVNGTTTVLVLGHDGVPGYILKKLESNKDRQAYSFAGNGTLAKYTRIPDDTLDNYINHFFMEGDVWTQCIKQSCRSGSVFIGSELISYSDLHKTPFFNEILLPSDAGHLLGGMMAMNDRTLSGITISRPAAKRDFGNKEKSFIRALLPHLTRAWQLHSHYTESNRSRLTTERSTDLVSTAMVLIAGDARIISLNRSAEAILGRQDGLIQKQGMLTAQNRDENSLLNKHISEAIETARHQAIHPGSGMIISRLSDKLPYQLIISPLNLHTDQTLPAPGAAVCVLIHDPHEHVHLAEYLLLDLYRLTASECKVARLFYQGIPLSRIGDMLDITFNTARTHLYNIMAKTGTHSQAGLMKLFALGPGAVRHDRTRYE